MALGQLWRRSAAGLAVALALASGLFAGAARSAGDGGPVPAAATPAAADQRVTVIGDSVLTAVLWYATPRAILQEGLDVQLEVAVCRRLIGVSCTFEGAQPPTLVDFVAGRTQPLGSTVVVAMGYNDFEQTFPAAVEQAVAALTKAGVRRILWATLREVRHPYVRMNAVLVAAARRHPELTVIDWNAYARNHPEWFQTDDIHLVPEGGAALATFLHAEIVRALDQPYPFVPVVDSFPPARLGHAYSFRLRARGGVAPYRWSARPLPQGLRLASNGRIVGRPTRAGRTAVVARATDARGNHATINGILLVRR
jgi:hypothetical protein